MITTRLDDAFFIVKQDGRYKLAVAETPVNKNPCVYHGRGLTGGDFSDVFCYGLFSGKPERWLEDRRIIDSVLEKENVELDVPFDIDLLRNSLYRNGFGGEIFTAPWAFIKESNGSG